MAEIIQVNKKVTFYMVVLLAIIIVMNLLSIGIIPVNGLLNQILFIILLIWISLGIAMVLRWVWKTFKPVEKI
ncbi:MAG: hypothetical protein ACTSYR_06365 [Candidatus Odinarchaeia archaeon]